MDESRVDAELRLLVERYLDRMSSRPQRSPARARARRGHRRPHRRPARRRSRRDRHRRRARRGVARPVGGGGRRARHGVRYVAVELEARARRPALPRPRTGRRRTRERRRARHLDDAHRAPPHPCAADAAAAAADVTRRHGRARLGRAPCRRRAAGIGAHTARGAPPAASAQPHRGARAGPGAANRWPARRAARRGTASSRTTHGSSSRIARTAAGHGARMLTRTRVTELSGDGARRARRADRHRARRSGRGRWSTPPACGPTAWCPASGCAPRAAPTWCCAAACSGTCPPRSWHPCPGTAAASCSRCHKPTARCTVGLTDEPIDGPDPRRARAQRERDRLPARHHRRGLRAAVASCRRGRGVRRAAPAARRGRLHRRPVAAAHRARVARRCRHRRRRQAHDLPADGRARRRCRAATDRDRRPARAAPVDLPLVGATDRESLAALEAPKRLVRRYGTEALAVLDNARAHGLRRARAARADRRGRPASPRPSCCGD